MKSVIATMLLLVATAANAKEIAYFENENPHYMVVATDRMCPDSRKGRVVFVVSGRTGAIRYGCWQHMHGMLVADWGNDTVYSYPDDMWTITKHGMDLLAKANKKKAGK